MNAINPAMLQQMMQQGGGPPGMPMPPGAPPGMPPQGPPQGGMPPMAPPPGMPIPPSGPMPGPQQGQPPGMNDPITQGLAMLGDLLQQLLQAVPPTDPRAMKLADMQRDIGMMISNQPGVQTIGSKQTNSDMDPFNRAFSDRSRSQPKDIQDVPPPGR